MAVSQSLVNDSTVQQVGDGANDTISGDQYLEGDVRYNDIIYGGAGDDFISGGQGTNQMYGEGGDDGIVVGQYSSANDQAYGGNGADYFTVFNTPMSGPIHQIDGGNGDDIVYIGLDSFSSGALLQNGTLSVDGTDAASLINVELIFGTSRNDTIAANGAMFQVQGLDGDDVISGANGNAMRISGDRGNDSLSGADLGDEIYDGDLALTGLAVIPRYYADNDTLRGNAGNDTLLAVSGNDSVLGNDGNDAIYTLCGDDTLKGGAGDDFFGFTYWHWYSEAAEPQKTDMARSQYNLGGLDISGGDGNDTVSFFGTYTSVASGDTFFDKGVDVNLGKGTGSEMASGLDRSFAITGVENLIGTDRKDKLTGDGAANRIEGGGDNDTLAGGNGNDTLIGDGGKDTLKGGNNNDVLDGVKKNDNLKGGAGNDTLLGGEGKDKLDGGGQMDVLIGGVGNDKLKGGADADVFEFFASLLPGDADTIKDFDLSEDLIRIVDANPLSFADLTISSVSGGAEVAYADWSVKLDGVNAASLSSAQFDFDTPDGTNGDDTIVGTNGADTLIGGAGDQVLDGQKDADKLKGGDGRDTLFGGKGADELLGGKGKDLLVGGKGKDKLTGGKGDDVFEFLPEELAGDADRIKDFALAEDLVRIQSATDLSFGDLVLKARDNGTKVLLDDWSVLLEGVDKADVSADLFDFVTL